jgi:hypothetical protein
MRLRALAVPSSVAVALLSSASAQTPEPREALTQTTRWLGDEITCNRTLLGQSDLFKGWLALWNEQIGKLELSDFEVVSVNPRKPPECHPLLCAPLDVYRRNNTIGHNTWRTLYLEAADGARSIEVSVCETDDPNAVHC